MDQDFSGRFAATFSINQLNPVVR